MRILVNRGTLGDIHGIKVLQDKYFERFIHQIYFKKKKNHWEDQKIIQILVCDSLLNNRLKAIAEYGFRQYKLI